MRTLNKEWHYNGVYELRVGNVEMIKRRLNLNKMVLKLNNKKRDERKAEQFRLLAKELENEEE